jgi:hypothetical protein
VDVIADRELGQVQMRRDFLVRKAPGNQTNHSLIRSLIFRALPLSISECSYAVLEDE